MADRLQLLANLSFTSTIRSALYNVAPRDFQDSPRRTQDSESRSKLNFAPPLSFCLLPRRLDVLSQQHDIPNDQQLGCRLSHSRRRRARARYMESRYQPRPRLARDSLCVHRHPFRARTAPRSLNGAPFGRWLRNGAQILPPGRRLVIATNVAPSSGHLPPSRGSTPPGPKGLFKSPPAVGNVPTRSTSNFVAGKDSSQSKSGATTTGSGGGSGATTPRAAEMESAVEKSEGDSKGAD